MLKNLVHLFLQEVKQFLATLCTHLSLKAQLILFLPDAAEVLTQSMWLIIQKLFDKILEKLVICKHVISTQADAAKNECSNFLQTVVKKNLSVFQDYQIDESRLD